MRAIILDNEPIMLERLEEKLVKFDNLIIIGKYTAPRDALRAILTKEPDIAFLEIDIAVLSGIEIAEIVKEKFPNIHIVFVTAYQDYAIQAFELDATDYIVKPVQLSRLQITMRRIKRFKERVKNIESTNSLENNNIFHQVCCFGSLEFKRSKDSNISNIKWRTKKTQELFAFLLHNEKKKVRKDTLVDILWPHLEWEQGVALLYSAVYHIRKVLRSIDFNITIENSENTYTLFLNEVKNNVVEWENKIELFGRVSLKNIDNYISVLKFYKGDYLAEYDYSWSEVEKKRLRSLWLYHIQLVNEFLMKKGEYIKAIQLNHFVQEVYPVGEKSYYNLMKLYNEIQEKNSVRVQYRALVKMLDEEYGIEPNSKIQQWYNQWKLKLS